MTVPSLDPHYGNFWVRPVDKTTDRPIVREIFRHEFYGSTLNSYPDECLWEIYDRMEPNDLFGAWLVFHKEEILFLLEVHPAMQMDLPGDYNSQPGAIGIYCFIHSREESLCLAAFKAFIDELLSRPGTDRILTTLLASITGDPKVSLFKQSGFKCLEQAADQPTIYSCTRESFQNILCSDALA